MLFRLDLNESREGFCRRGRGRSFHADGLKTEKTQEPTRGIKLECIYACAIKPECHKKDSADHTPKVPNCAHSGGGTLTGEELSAVTIGDSGLFHHRCTTAELQEASETPEE